MRNSSVIQGLLTVMLIAAVTLSSARAEQGFVGMQIQDMPKPAFEALGEDNAFGLLVRDVGLGTPAAISGFLRGDILTEIEGEEINSIAQAVAVLQTRKPGDTVSFELLRGGEEMELSLELGEWLEHWRRGHSGFATIPVLGITLATISDQVQEQMGLRWVHEVLLSHWWMKPNRQKRDFGAAM